MDLNKLTEVFQKASQVRDVISKAGVIKNWNPEELTLALLVSAVSLGHAVGITDEKLQEGLTAICALYKKPEELN